MKPWYDELTHRSKHELRELDDDPWNWFEGPDRSDPWHRFSGWHVVAAVLLVAVLGGLLVVGFIQLVGLFAR